MADEKTLVVRILADTKSAEDGMDKVTRKTDGMGEKFKQSAANAAMFLAGMALKAVKDFAEDSIRAFSDLEQAQGGTVAIFGASADAIDEFAKNSADAIGVSEAEFRTATTSIGGQLKRMTGDVDFAAEHSIELTRTAADLAATYGGTTADAVAALGAAFRGEADPAERFNLNLKVSEVNAKAVEMGLAAATTEVDENARAQALLELITEQSADAQGQFAREADTVAGATQRANAQLENQKAIVGEVVAPWQTLKNEAMGGLGRVLADITTEFRQLTGEISDGEAALTDWAVYNGRWASTAEEVIDAAKSTGTSLADIIPHAELSGEELQNLADRSGALAEEFDLTAEEAEALDDALRRRLAAGMTESETAARETTAAMAALREEQADTEDQVEETTSALEDQTNKLRAMSDPLFGVIKSSRDLEAAEKAYQEAVKAGDTEAQLKAIEDITGANMGLRDAYNDLIEQGIDPTSQAARRMFEDVGGLTPGQIDQILGTFRSIQSRMPILDLKVMAPGIEYQERAGKITPRTSKEHVLAAGGIARATPGGIPARIAEAGQDEVVSPLDQLIGMVRDAVRDELGTSHAGGGGSVTLQINASRHQPLDGWAIVEALQTVQRHYGTVPIKVSDH